MVGAGTKMFGNALFQGAQEGMENLSGRAAGGKEIDWEDYNYPCGCNILHYEVDDVEDPACKSAVRWAHVSYWMLFAGLVGNFLGCVILAGMGLDGKGITVLYSVFNFIIAGICGMYGFYNCYKGLATRNMKMSRWYIVIEIFGLIFMLVSATVSGSNFNGLSGVTKAEDESGSLKGMMLGWSAFEGSYWLVTFIVSAVALVKVIFNRRYGRPAGTPAGFLGMMRL